MEEFSKEEHLICCLSSILINVKDQSPIKCDEGRANLKECEDRFSDQETKIATDEAKQGRETLKKNH